MKENNGMPRKEGKLNYLEQKCQARLALLSLLNKYGQFEVKRTVSFLSLETGLGEGTLNKMVASMVTAGEIVIQGNLAVTPDNAIVPNENESL